MVSNNTIKVISFDLDDSLYDNRPVLQNAEAISKAYLEEAFSKQQQAFNFDHFLNIRKQLLVQKKPAFENMNLFRRTALSEFCQSLDNADEIVENAFRLFIQARSLVTIEPTIHSLLEHLAQRFTLVTVTNGNCDPRRLSIAELFSAHLSPQEGYRAKPHPQMLQAVIESHDIAPTELLHVGDSLEYDGAAAEAAGSQFFHFIPFQETNSLDVMIDNLKRKLNLIR